MELSQIPKQGQWSDIADVTNGNFNKVNMAVVEGVEQSTKAAAYASRYANEASQNLAEIQKQIEEMKTLPSTDPALIAKVASNTEGVRNLQASIEELNAVVAGGFVYDLYGYKNISDLQSSNANMNPHAWNVVVDKKPYGKVSSIQFKAKTGIIKFYKIKPAQSVAQNIVTDIISVTNTSNEDGKIKTINVNVTLTDGEYIAVSGAVYYGNTDDGYGYYYTGNSNNYVSGKNIAYNYQIETEKDGLEIEIEGLNDIANNALFLAGVANDSIDEIKPILNGGESLENYGNADLLNMNNNNIVESPYWNVDKSKSNVGNVTQIRFKAKEGTIRFLKITNGGTPSTCTYTQISEVVNTAEENGTIKTINVNVTLEANQYIGVIGAVFFVTRGLGDDYEYYSRGTSSISKTPNAQIAYNAIYRITNNGLVKDVEVLKEKVKGVVINPNVYIVDANGKGDFTTIQDALIGTYGKDTKANPITIKVNAGTIIERPMNGVFYPYAYGRNLSIIGEDKVNTIIISKNSYYYPQVQDGSCIKVAGNVYIANLTIISSDEEYEEPSGTEHTDRHHSYCIHIDSTAAEGDITEIHNCRLVNYHNCCIGAGIKKGHTIKITDCELYSELMYPNERYGGCTIYAHDENGDTSITPTEHLYIKNCAIESNSNVAIKMLSVYNSLMKATFVNNVCTYNVNGKGFEIDKLDKITLTAACFGNNINSMNK